MVMMVINCSLHCTCLKCPMIGEKEKKTSIFQIPIRNKTGKKILFTPNLLIHENMFLMKSLHWKEPERASDSRIPKSG